MLPYLERFRRQVTKYLSALYKQEYKTIAGQVGI